MSIIDIISFDCDDSDKLKNNEIYDTFSDEWKNKLFFRNILEDNLDLENMTDNELLRCVEIFNYLCKDDDVFIDELFFKIKERNDIFTKKCEYTFTCNNFHLNILLFNKFKRSYYYDIEIYKSKDVTSYLITNNFRMVKYINFFYDGILDDAVRYNCGNEIINWLLENNCHFSNSSMYYAVQNNNIDAIKILFTQGYTFDDLTFSAAASNGNLTLMKWLKENGCEYSHNTFSAAASNGNLENMKWLLDNKCKFDKYTLHNAIEKGILNNIKWLKENGCE